MTPPVPDSGRNACPQSTTMIFALHHVEKGQTKFGQKNPSLVTKFGQDQVWPRPSLAKTKFGQTKFGQDQVWPHCDAFTRLMSAFRLQQAFMWSIAAGDAPHEVERRGFWGLGLLGFRV